ncbi:MAG: DUF4199 family protein [Rubricoccaceae bacterium]|nr:DUF4199 family protein [Rubricoccaceae bacterium]
MPSKTQSIIVGALVYVVLGLLIQFLFIGTTLGGVLGCLVLLSAGLIAVWHYTSTHSVTIAGGQGAGMGALAGFAGAIIGGLLGYLLISLGVMDDPMEAALAQMESQGLSDEQIEQGMAMAERFSNPVISMVIGSALGAILGAISGAVGALIFKKGGDEDEVVA